MANVNVKILLVSFQKINTTQQDIGNVQLFDVKNMHMILLKYCLVNVYPVTLRDHL